MRCPRVHTIIGRHAHEAAFCTLHTPCLCTRIRTLRMLLAPGGENYVQGTVLLSRRLLLILIVVFVVDPSRLSGYSKRGSCTTSNISVPCAVLLFVFRHWIWFRALDQCIIMISNTDHIFLNEYQVPGTRHQGIKQQQSSFPPVDCMLTRDAVVFDCKRWSL